jgi:hypothetical protein
MVARLLRLESLEGRRLMAVDFDALPLTVDSSTDSQITLVGQPTNGPVNEQLAFATSDEVVVTTGTADPLYFPERILSTATLVQKQSTSNPFLVETENYLVVLQTNFGQQLSRLNLVQ